MVGHLILTVIWSTFYTIVVRFHAIFSLIVIEQSRKESSDEGICNYVVLRKAGLRDHQYEDMHNWSSQKQTESFLYSVLSVGHQGGSTSTLCFTVLKPTLKIIAQNWSKSGSLNHPQAKKPHWNSFMEARRKMSVRSVKGHGYPARASFLLYAKVPLEPHGEDQVNRTYFEDSFTDNYPWR